VYNKKIWLLVFSFSFWFQYIQRIEQLCRNSKVIHENTFL
jgi:hypothetical protein